MRTLYTYIVLMKTNLHFPMNLKEWIGGKTNNYFLIKLVDQNRFKIGTMINEYGTTYVVASNA